MLLLLLVLLMLLWLLLAGLLLLQTFFNYDRERPKMDTHNVQYFEAAITCSPRH
jgi:hypothetical protein